jgi:general secretion pathway protein A
MTAQSFFGFTRFPFQNQLPDPLRLYTTPTHTKIADRFQHFLELEHGVGLLTGEVGAGKSSLLRFLLHPLANHHFRIVVMNSYPAKPRGFLRFLLQKLDRQPAFYAELLFSQMQATLTELRQQNGVMPLFVFDEAQNIADPVLEQIRLMSEFENPPLLLLVAPLQFRARLKQLHYQSLTQRLTFQAVLQPLSRSEIEAYIQHNLKKSGLDRPLFTNDAITMIFNHSRGIPRLVNQLCRDVIFTAAKQQLMEIPDSLIEESILLEP